MCTTFVVTFGVSAIEGLAGGVIQNYKLNDLQVTPRHEGEDGDSRLTPLILRSSTEIRERALEDFSSDDCLFEEFSPPSKRDFKYRDSFLERPGQDLDPSSDWLGPTRGHHPANCSNDTDVSVKSTYSKEPPEFAGHRNEHSLLNSRDSCLESSNNNAFRTLEGQKNRNNDDLEADEERHKSNDSYGENLSDEEDKSLNVDFSWRNYRPQGKLRWLATCFLYSFYMVVLCSFLVAAISVGIMFVDINTADACYFTPWHRVPLNVQRVRVSVQVVQGWILQFFHIGVLIFVFGFKLIDQLHLLHLNVIAAFIDSVYRLFFQVYDVYDWPQRMFPLNAIFVCVMIANSYTLAKHFTNQRGRKLIITFQLGSQFMLGAATLFLTFYLLVPWFVKLGPFQQALVAGVSPIFGAINKAISRIVIQNVSNINHPGTSYMLVIAVYAGAALVYRALQAELESSALFLFLCFAHALIGFLERLSVVLRDHFYFWFYKKVLKKERDYNSFVGSFRTPRTQRLVADLTICNIIHETNALIYTNAFVQFYSLQIGIDGQENAVDVYDVVSKFFIRSFSAILIEYVFTAFGIFILTWYMNIPVIRVWRKKWKSILAGNLFVCACLVIYSTQYLLVVVADRYQHTIQSKNETMSCDLSNIPFFKK
ncbi:uncharacterized protein [Clytia hemisphaerica]|uniref:Uncharacterized protein n=1 Tax=Clytia hemisphaerica TaxID=252671 RepID=A0A7M5UTC5_9CNID